MSSADFDMAGARPSVLPNGLPSPASTVGGPCAPARAEVDVRCAEAERLLVAAQAHQETLREARRQHGDATRLREADSYLRDRRRLADDKARAQADYHAALARATDHADVQDAAAAWLHRVDHMNRQARAAEKRAESLGLHVQELERTLPGLEMAADASRIAAEAAQMTCMDARRALAACEEASGPRTPSHANSPNGMYAQVATIDMAVTESPGYARVERDGILRAARALTGGDRQTLLGLALRLAEETGLEAGRLQLLLIELREQIYLRALDDGALAFPNQHPFWSQFPGDAARGVAKSLASMGFRFDGVAGWADSRAPQLRDLVVALSYCGYEARSLRRPAGQAAIDALWQGTTVRVEEYLLARAPELTLTQIVDLLGDRSSRLAELWDIWGRLRPLLMRTG